MRFAFKKRWLGIAILFLAAYACLTRFYVTPILMYHHIDGRSQEWKLSVSPESFRRQMEFLKAHGYRVLSLSEYVRMLGSGEKSPRKSVVLTFDDGYDNNFTHAYPVLQALDFPATIYVQVDGLGREGYLTREDAAILAESGVDIGSHTLSHAHLPDLSADRVLEEIFESKKILEQITGREVLNFSYPGGGWTPAARDRVREAGYLSATATHAGPHDHSDPYLLRRIRISRTADNLFVFWIKISGFYTYIEDFRG